MGRRPNVTFTHGDNQLLDVRSELLLTAEEKSFVKDVLGARMAPKGKPPLSFNATIRRLIQQEMTKPNGKH